MSRQSWSLKSLLVLSALTAILAVGCSSTPNQPPAPGIEPEVLNSTNTFQLQVSSVENYTGVVEYVWSNTGIEANINQSCNIQPNQALLRIIDADGTEVYSQDLSVDGSFASELGVSGDWRVRVEMTAMTGTLNFRAEIRTP